MNWAGVTIIVLQSMSLLINAHYHGKEKEGKHNFWISFVSACISMFLIWKAGAFG